MPFLCVWFATKADKYPYPFNVFILVSFIALQMYAISYMAYYFEFVFLMCWLVRCRFKIVIGRIGRDRGVKIKHDQISANKKLVKKYCVRFNLKDN